jgi:hypothetical protein
MNKQNQKSKISRANILLRRQFPKINAPVVIHTHPKIFPDPALCSPIHCVPEKARLKN